MFTIESVMNQLITWFYYGAMKLMTEFETYIGQMGLELFDNDYSIALLTFFLLLARALLVIGIILALFEYAISAQSGGGNLTDTGLSILKGMAATELFTIIPVKLYALTVQIQTVMGDLLNPATQAAADAAADQSGSVMTNILAGGISLFTSMVSSQPLLFVSGFVSGSQSSASAEQHIPAITTIIFLVVFLISFIRVIFDNIKRGAILLVQICVASLYMVSVPRGITDGFYGWCKQVVGLCFTSFIQNIFLIVGMGAFAQNNIIMGLAIMMTASEVPRIAQAFGLDTSFKMNVTGMMMGVNSAMSLGRLLMKGVK